MATRTAGPSACRRRRGEKRTPFIGLICASWCGGDDLNTSAPLRDAAAASRLARQPSGSACRLASTFCAGSRSGVEGSPLRRKSASIVIRVAVSSRSGLPVFPRIALASERSVDSNFVLIALSPPIAAEVVAMCNPYSVTKGQSAIRDLSSVKQVRPGNLPPLPAIFSPTRWLRSSASAPMVSASWSWRAVACRGCRSIAAGL